MPKEYGHEYFTWQKEASGEYLGGIIESRKFSPFIGENDTVLDFGCGGGYILHSIRCKRKIGIEINPFARELAKKNLNLVFEDLDMVENDSVDVIISNHAIEHVPCPLNEILKCSRCLKQNGSLILYVPINDWRNEKKFMDNDINNHLYTWSPQLLGNLVSSAGFSIEDVKIVTHAWPPNFLIFYKNLPEKLFDLLCKITSIIYRRRQICLVARKKNSN
jgi:SAM-dependent methyltransferase